MSVITKEFIYWMSVWWWIEDQKCIGCPLERKCHPDFNGLHDFQKLLPERSES